MHKPLSLVLALALLGGLAACGKPEPAPPPVIEPEPVYQKM